MSHPPDKESFHVETTHSIFVEERIVFHHIIKINERGVVVIPREILDTMDIREGSKMMLLSISRNGKTQTIVLLPSDQFSADIDEKLKDPDSQSV